MRVKLMCVSSTNIVTAPKSRAQLMRSGRTHSSVRSARRAVLRTCTQHLARRTEKRNPREIPSAASGGGVAVQNDIDIETVDSAAHTCPTSYAVPFNA